MATVVEAITQREAANRLRITTAWVRELTGRGILSRNPDGSYPWPAVADEYDEFKKRDGGAEPKSGYQVELARLTKQKADTAEMENAQRRGELVPFAEVSSLVRDVMEAGDRKLRATPRRLAKRWAKKLKVSEAHAIELIELIVEDVRAILREAAEDKNDAAAA